MANDVLVGTGTGAASGALMGSMIAPGVGTAIGGILGGATGALGGMGQRSAAKAQRAALAAQRRAQEAEMARRQQGVQLAQQQFGDVWSLGDAPAFREWGGTAGRPGKAGTGALIGAGIGGAVSLGMGATAGGALGAAMGRKRRTAQAYGNNQAEIDAYNARKNATILRHGQLAGGIESNAQAVRDAGMSQLAGAGQQAAVAQRGASLDRGLLGSSLDESARKMLLAQYAANRAGVAQATEDARDSGWRALKQQQAMFENAARGGSDISAQMRSLATAGQIAGARAQMPYIAFGNLLNTGMGVLDAGARSEAAGGRGLTALGLPRLGLAGAGDRASGATTSRGV